MKQIKAQLTISRLSGHTEGRPIRIEVGDEASGVTFLRLRLSLENFASALTGLGCVECDGTFWEDAPVGEIRETKTELIPRPGWNDRQKREAIAADLLKPFETDGWKGTASDLFNHHHARGDNQAVSFHRYVDPPAPRPPANHS